MSLFTVFMKILIISDIHDHIHNLDKVRQKVNSIPYERVICCGDICAPFMIGELEKFEKPVDVIFGNTDDRYLTTLKASESSVVALHGDTAILELGNRHICVNHFPHIARAFAHEDTYDAVFFGHTHKMHEEAIGRTLLVNPGEIMGRFKIISFAIYDTNENTVKFYEVDRE